MYKSASQTPPPGQPGGQTPPDGAQGEAKPKDNVVDAEFVDVEDKK